MPSNSSNNEDGDIRMAYDSVSQHGSLNWLLLSYGKWAGGLKLFAAGSQGLLELKSHITNDNVYFAFCREVVSDIHYFVTVAYIPDSVSGLRKARALATSRTVHSWFKVSQAMVTVHNPEYLTIELLVRAACANQSTSTPALFETVTRPSSDNYDADKSLPRPPNIAPSSQFSDSDKRSLSVDTTRSRHPVDFGSPAERAKRRQEAQGRQVVDNEVAAREEALRQARIKQEKEEILKSHDEQEHKRRESLERDLRKAAAIKLEREETERLAAEQRAIDRESKRRREAERRLANSRQIQALRQEEELRLNQLIKQEEQLLQTAEATKQASRAAATKLRHERLARPDQILLRGWVTVQNVNSLIWRRRYFLLNATSLVFYKDDKATDKTLDTIVLADRLRGVKEWNEGFEELKAIPHSFAMTFKGEQDALLAYSDSAEEKIELVGFLLTYL